MLKVEEGYDAYRRGEISYEEYRKQYADPEDADRLKRKAEAAIKSARRR